MGIYVKDRKRWRRTVGIFGATATFGFLARVWIWDAVPVIHPDTVLFLAAVLPPVFLVATRRESD
jgi:hypothetical protein